MKILNINAIFRLLSLSHSIVNFLSGTLKLQDKLKIKNITAPLNSLLLNEYKNNLKDK